MKSRRHSRAAASGFNDRHAGSVRMRRSSPAIAERGDVVLVAQSLAGVRPCGCCVRKFMIPKPGETAGAWWDATGAAEVRRKAAEFDLATDFLHDVPEDVLRAGPLQPREEAEIVFGESCRFELWPDIPIYLLAGRDDRFFPIEFQRRIAHERLGKEVEEIRGGHLLALSNPGRAD